MSRQRPGESDRSYLVFVSLWTLHQLLHSHSNGAKYVETLCYLKALQAHR